MSRQLSLADYASLLRVVLTPACLLLLVNTPIADAAVLAIIILAIFSDYLDGYWARKYGMVSHRGAFLDFTADKIFTLSVLAIFLAKGVLPIWIFLLILNRETIVAGLRLLAALEGWAVHAQWLGKIKTVFTFIAMIALLVEPYLSLWLGKSLKIVADIIVWLATFFTLASGIEYMVKISRFLEHKPPNNHS